MRFALYLVSAVSLCAQVPDLTLAEKEEFLRTAKVVSTKDSKTGITGTIRATLSNGKLTHDAQIQTIDESKSRFEGSRGVEINFRDSYKFNIAGYRLGRLLGLNMIPPSVERNYAGKSAAFTWWIDEVMFDEAARMRKKEASPDTEKWNREMNVVRIFDQLIANTDRNLGNLLITKNWDIWMIDHTRAFRISKELLNAKNLVMCDRNFLAAMRKLDNATIRTAMANYITSSEISGILARRDKIVKFFEAGGEKALFTLESRP